MLRTWRGWSGCAGMCTRCRITEGIIPKAHVDSQLWHIAVPASSALVQQCASAELASSVTGPLLLPWQCNAKANSSICLYFKWAVTVVSLAWCCFQQGIVEYFWHQSLRAHPFFSTGADKSCRTGTPAEYGSRPVIIRASFHRLSEVTGLLSRAGATAWSDCSRRRTAMLTVTARGPSLDARIWRLRTDPAPKELQNWCRPLT